MTDVDKWLFRIVDAASHSEANAHGVRLSDSAARGFNEPAGSHPPPHVHILAPVRASESREIAAFDDSVARFAYDGPIMARFRGRSDDGFSDAETTDPMIREDLPLGFDPTRRIYHYLPPEMPDAVTIGHMVLQVAKMLHGPDTKRIIDAGLGEELHRFLAQLAAQSGLAASGAIKDAMYGLPS